MQQYRSEMSPEEIASWCEEKLGWLSAKKQRELSYLSRRSQRGVRTPTDEAYSTDQVHEADLIAALEHMIRQI